MRKTIGLIWLLLLAGAVHGASRYSAYDLALHLQQCAKRPVFFTLRTAGEFSGDTLPPCDKDSLKAWLAERHLKLFWQDSALLIDRPDIYSGHDLAYQWTALRLDVLLRRATTNDLPQEPDSTDDYKYVPERRDISETELQDTEEWILREVPMPPVSSPVYCPSCGAPAQTAVLNLEIVLDAVKLSKTGPEFIIGRLSSKSASRIIVGRYEEKKFHLEWLSPLLQPYRAALIFRDVNADGVAEIWSFSIYMAGSKESWALSIFDWKGSELTRDAGDCSVAVGVAAPTSATILPAACPITGFPVIEHYLDEVGNGHVVLRAHQDYGENQSPPYIFRLVSGRYLRVRPKPAHRVR